MPRLKRKRDSTRNLWRFFEILLFFMISVIGHVVFCKTSFNPKTKASATTTPPYQTEQYSELITSLALPCISLQVSSINAQAPNIRNDRCCAPHTVSAFRPVAPDLHGYQPNTFQQNRILLL